jgi:uncharacterized protein (TIGR03437 family)
LQVRLEIMTRRIQLFYQFILFCNFLFLNVLPAEAQSQLSVVSAADYQPVVSPSSLASIFGTALSTTTQSAELDSSGQLPTQLGGISVTVNGQAAALIYVSPRQINLVIPEGIQPGTANVLVNTVGVRLQGTADVRKVAPALFSNNGAGTGPGAILNAVTYAQNPFLVETPENGGEDKRTRLAVYATGVRLADGSRIRAQITSDTNRTLDLPVEFAGAAPGFFGLDQVNVVLPAEADGLGVVHLSLTAESVSSNVVDFTMALLPASRVRLADLSLSKAVVAGGDPVSAVVSLNAPAPPGGVLVQLQSTNAAVAQVQVVATVPENSVSVEVPIQTRSPAAATDVQITASAAGVSRTATLRVNRTDAPSLSGLSLSPGTVYSGGAATGTVTLSSNAGFGGVSVALQSDNASLQVPETVTVPFAQTTASFTATSTAVNDSVVARVTASLDGVVKTAQVTLNPLLSLTLASDSVPGGSDTSARVTLSDPAPNGGANIQLGTSDLILATVPSSVTITAGQTSTQFTIQTTPPTVDRPVSITAAYRGVSQSKTLTVTSALQGVISKVEISPMTVRGGTSATGTVTLARAAGPGGLIVSLRSDTIAAAGVDSFVTVPAGQASVTFVVRTSPVISPRVVTITATASGVSTTATFTVN